MEIRFTLDSYSLVKNDTWFWDCRDEDVNEEFSNVYSKYNLIVLNDVVINFFSGHWNY